MLCAACLEPRRRRRPNATQVRHPLRKHLQSGSTVLRILILATLLAMRSLGMERPYLARRTWALRILTRMALPASQSSRTRGLSVLSMGNAGALLGLARLGIGDLGADYTAVAVVFEDDVSPETDFVPRLWSLVTQELSERSACAGSCASCLRDDSDDD